MQLIIDLIQRWGFRFFKNYVDLEQRVTVLEESFKVQIETNKGLIAEIEELKKR